MQRLGTSLVVLTLLAIGYSAGNVGLLTPEGLWAQGAAAPQGPSEDAVDKITNSFDTAKAAAASLKREGRYETATQGLNLFAVSVGGLDVMQYGVYQARRAGLTKKDVANTKTWKQFEKLLKKSR